jgi:four helix bundle protein
MGNFQELTVWKRSKNFAVYMYSNTSVGNFMMDLSLREQIRRAAVSIPSNIAEGDELGSNKQSVKFFNIAKGSAAEVFTQAIIAHEIGYLSQEQIYYIMSECQAISSMLSKLIQVRKLH